MSSHSMPMPPERHEGGDGMEMPAFDRIGGGMMPPPDPGHGLVDFSQLPPPALSDPEPLPSYPGLTPAPAAAPSFTAAAPGAPASAASGSAGPASDAAPAPLPQPAPGSTIPEVLPAMSAPADSLASLPGITMPEPMPTMGDFTMPDFSTMISPLQEQIPGVPATALPFADLGDLPEFEVLPPTTRSASRRRAERAFIDDEFTAQARRTVDNDLIDALEAVIDEGASDLHISVNSQPMLRIDGSLTPVPSSEIWDRERVASALYSLMSDEQRAHFDEHLELDFAFTLSEQSRFRVNYYLQRGAIGAAFRLIPTKIRPLGDLGMPPAVSTFAGLPRGLVLVTGPTGSGKSTTLAALVDLVNQTRADHIVTVEDPIEFMHTNKKAVINQREVGNDTHSFANALKHVLRQDPDVILIGELRDLETISVALTAAETGHLVFATLHTQSAGATIDRVIDVFPPHQQDQVRTQLAATLQGVVCQTLVKRVGGDGRAVATEVMFTTPAVSNLIREGKTYQIASVLQSGGAQGMHTMDQSLAELVNEGQITKAVAMEKAQDPETLERLITRVDMSGHVGDAFSDPRMQYANGGTL